MRKQESVNRALTNARAYYPDRARQRHRLPLANGVSASRIDWMPPRATRPDGPPARGSPGRSAGALHRAVDPAPSRHRTSGQAPSPYSVKPAAAEDACAHVLRRRTRTARILRPQLRQFRHMLVDRLQRRHHPGGFRAARASTRMPAAPSAATPCANWQTTATGSAKNITPNRDASRSKLAGSNGIDRGVGKHVVDRKIPGRHGCRARSSIGPETSIPNTWPTARPSPQTRSWWRRCRSRCR